MGIPFLPGALARVSVASVATRNLGLASGSPASYYFFIDREVEFLDLFLV